MGCCCEEIIRAMRRIEKFLISNEEFSQLGHRIVFDAAGKSLNVPGSRCDPQCLDADGYRVRFEDV